MHGEGKLDMVCSFSRCPASRHGSGYVLPRAIRDPSGFCRACRVNELGTQLEADMFADNANVERLEVIQGEAKNDGVGLPLLCSIILDLRRDWLTSVYGNAMA